MPVSRRPVASSVMVHGAVSPRERVRRLRQTLLHSGRLFRSDSLSVDRATGTPPPTFLDRYRQNFAKVYTDTDQVYCLRDVRLNRILSVRANQTQKGPVHYNAMDGNV